MNTIRFSKINGITYVTCLSIPAFLIDIAYRHFILNGLDIGEYEVNENRTGIFYIKNEKQILS